jgi:uncharacterized protein (UPF0264 family)
MKLLVSVRSVEEAKAAVEGGADLIDIKEPDRGPLGKADDSVIAAIVDAVSGRRPVSAAMGELCELASPRLPSARLEFVKFGLAKIALVPWCDRLLQLRAASNSAVVPTAYADWERAGSPPVERIALFAATYQFPVLLIDTCEKDGSNLLSWLDRDNLEKIVAPLREAGCKVALAGSLNERDFEVIVGVQPEWIAVRGAACTNGDRKRSIDVKRVRYLKAALLTSGTPDRG